MALRLYEDKEHAADYLKYRVTPNEVICEIMGQVKERMPQSLNLAVDVGCGSGQGTVLLAPYFSKVVGMDISPAQLENARANQHPPNVTYSESPAEVLPFESGTVDLLTAMSAAHWFDHQRFLVEADRILRPGGCLVLLSYAMDMELEFGDVTDELNEVCKELYTALLPYRNPHLGPSYQHKYQEMFNSWPYPDKKWHDGPAVRRVITVNGYIGLFHTFTAYQKLRQNYLTEAERLSNHIQNKLLDAMQVSSPETEVTMVTKYFYWLGWKP